MCPYSTGGSLRVILMSQNKPGATILRSVLFLLPQSRRKVMATTGTRMYLRPLPPWRWAPTRACASCCVSSLTCSSSGPVSGAASSSASVTLLVVFLLNLLLRTTVPAPLRPASSSLLLEFVAAGCGAGKATARGRKVWRAVMTGPGGGACTRHVDRAGNKH